MKYVKGLEDLVTLAQKQRSVKLNNGAIVPAAFVMGMPGRTIWGFIIKGMEIYTKKVKLKPPDDYIKNTNVEVRK